ncbi:uncharacterized protein LOC143913834 [Arctopsyche grandis]|uniref:uncharacterized protein LOC143913834 n=1 Tax=Arctopsyche grandis TaxID=121162 RepID=UPI00406D966C
MSASSSSLLLLCCLLAAIITPICGYKILFICPLPARSHNNLCRGVVDSLVERGHEVTFVSAFAAVEPKYRDFPIENIMSFKDEEFNLGFSMLNRSYIETIKMLSRIQPKMMKFMYDDKAINKFLSDKSEKFDLVIFEHFFNEAVIGFGVKYTCPVIALSPVNLMTWLATMTNNPLAPEIVPNVFSNFSSNMDLWQRVTNVGMIVVQEVLERLIIRPIQESVYEEYFPKESKRVPYDQLTKRISLVLVNSHPSIGIARPLLPNAIEIAGYHIKDPESLPDDLKTILDSAKEGVVYFSMGSNLKSSQMSPELKAIILKALGNLKQTVLWKYEEDLPGKPKNVIIRKWMPQTGILAHPNVKLFISHGGFLSCTEASHFGVPLLAIPIFGDQSINAMALVRRGHGVVLDYMNITDVSFKWALDEVLENPRYTETAKQVHQLYHDRPMRPRDLLVYYVEHVVRTKGAPHLAPPQLPRYSQLMLDVIGIFLIPLLTVGSLFSFVLWRCFYRKKKEKMETMIHEILLVDDNVVLIYSLVYPVDIAVYCFLTSNQPTPKATCDFYIKPIRKRSCIVRWNFFRNKRLCAYTIQIIIKYTNRFVNISTLSKLTSKGHDRVSPCPSCIPRVEPRNPRAVKPSSSCTVPRAPVFFIHRAVCETARSRLRREIRKNRKSCHGSGSTFTEAIHRSVFLDPSRLEGTTTWCTLIGEQSNWKRAHLYAYICPNVGHFPVQVQLQLMHTTNIESAWIVRQHLIMKVNGKHKCIVLNYLGLYHCILSTNYSSDILVFYRPNLLIPMYQGFGLFLVRTIIIMPQNIVSELIEPANEYQRPLYLGFDKVSHISEFNTLQTQGVPNIDRFSIGKEVRQGDTITFKLFNANSRILLGILCVCISMVNGSKILKVCLAPSKSHHILCQGVVDTLADTGHELLLEIPVMRKVYLLFSININDNILAQICPDNEFVTFINSFATNSKRYKEITISELSNSLQKHHPGFKTNLMSIVKIINVLPLWQQEVTKTFFNHPKIVDFFNDKNQNFDLVIIEYFMNEMFIGYFNNYVVRNRDMHNHKTRIRNVELSKQEHRGAQFYNALPDNIRSAKNISAFLKGDIGYLCARCSFKGKSHQYACNDIHRNLGNVSDYLGKTFKVLKTKRNAYYEFFLDPTSRKLYAEYMPKEAKLVPFEDLRKHVSMVFANSHPSVGLARPLLPNTIEIGGYHIADPKPLPKDLQEVIDSAKHGVIFFSMGSNLKSKDMDVELRQNILKVLSGFKETVLWKFEENLPDKPKNVIIRKWMPQSSILAHKNVKLFISHCGLLSVTETTYFGVPLLAIPVYGDQFHNAMTVSEKGQGVVLSLSNITEASLKWSINEVISNPKYTEMAKMNQKLFHDRPIKPRKLLAFYVDHIIRTKGAKYLSPPSLSRASQLLLDIAVVILIPLVSIAFLFALICRKLNRYSQLLLDAMAIILIPIIIIVALFSYMLWKCCNRKNKQKI